MDAAMLKRLLDCLKEAADGDWHVINRRLRRYQIGPHSSDLVVYRGDGLFRAESHLAAIRLRHAHVAAQEAIIRQKIFVYRSLRTGHKLTFQVKHLELLRHLDLEHERGVIGSIKDDQLSDVPRELIRESTRPGERGQAILTHEASDAIRLFNMLLENSR